MRVPDEEERKGIFTHAISSPELLLYLSISWSSLVFPSDSVNMISYPSERALFFRSESMMSISIGKSLRSPATLEALMVIGFR